MASIRTLKRRIKSVKNIREITKAMEMISAVRFKRVETRYRRSLPYTQSLEGLIQRIVTPEVAAAHPLFEKRERRKELLITVTGDRGLCGSFNTNLLRNAEAVLKECAGREVWVFSIGKVGTGFAKRRGWKLYDTLSDLGYRFTPDSLAPLSDRLVKEFLSGGFDSIDILSMSAPKGGYARPLLEPYLGLSFLAEGKALTAAETDPSTSLRVPSEQCESRDYIFEPDRASTLATLVGLFVRQRFFITLLRSVTAEYNARMVAMKLATDNGKELLKELTLERNKVRQAMITKEISEIIGGVNALS